MRPGQPLLPLPAAALAGIVGSVTLGLGQKVASDKFYRIVDGKADERTRLPAVQRGLHSLPRPGWRRLHAKLIEFAHGAELFDGIAVGSHAVDAVTPNRPCRRFVAFSAPRRLPLPCRAVQLTDEMARKPRSRAAAAERRRP
jgi:hypothetical protein